MARADKGRWYENHNGEQCARLSSLIRIIRREEIKAGIIHCTGRNKFINQWIIEVIDQHVALTLFRDDHDDGGYLWVEPILLNRIKSIELYWMVFKWLIQCLWLVQLFWFVEKKSIFGSEFWVFWLCRLKFSGSSEKYSLSIGFKIEMCPNFGYKVNILVTYVTYLTMKLDSLTFPCRQNGHDFHRFCDVI